MRMFTSWIAQLTFTSLIVTNSPSSICWSIGKLFMIIIQFWVIQVGIWVKVELNLYHDEHKEPTYLNTSPTPPTPPTSPTSPTPTASNLTGQQIQQNDRVEAREALLFKHHRIMHVLQCKHVQARFLFNIILVGRDSKNGEVVCFTRLLDYEGRWSMMQSLYYIY